MVVPSSTSNKSSRDHHILGAYVPVLAFLIMVRSYVYKIVISNSIIDALEECLSYIM